MTIDALTSLLFKTLPKLDPELTLDADTIETGTMLLNEADKLGKDILYPLRWAGDKEGCSLVDGRVTTPKGSQEAWAAMRDNGWLGMSMPEDLGGSALSPLLATPVGALFSSYNQAFTMTQGLTQGAADLLLAHRGDPQNGALIEKILTGFVNGTVTGTMNLTEPQCGTDLGLITTKAEETDDGWAISGQKIWISSGDQDLSDIVAHLVLAREPNLEAGIKGVSLFLVPSHLSTPEGWSDTRNAVTCIGLEEKMGIHASPTCVMAYDKAWGVRIGDPGKGVRQMFTMMNAARLLVAGQGLAGAHAAYAESLAFAKDRRAGRAIGHPPSDQKADSILVHADVRRMLLEQEAFIKAGWVALGWGAGLMEETGERKALLDLLIPILKSTLTDKGLESALTAQQLMGGMGYVTDGKVESIVRDLRITTVYEGTNGIQALDLVGRKLAAQGGAGTRLFLKHMTAVSKDTPIEPLMTDAIAALSAILAKLMEWGMKDPERVTGVMVDVQEAFGLVLMGGCLAAQSDDDPELALFWANRHLPKVDTLGKRILNSDWVKSSFSRY